MKLWLSKNGEVSIIEQLTAQITLGISSHGLMQGEKLPSTRELARRFGIHQNTVIGAYRRLADIGLVEFRKGSGVYVSQAKVEKVEFSDLESIIDRFIREASTSGYTLSEVATELQSRLHVKNVRRFVLVETNVEIRNILISEIEFAAGYVVEGIAFEDLSALPESEDRQLIGMFSEKEKIEKALPPNSSCIYLRANSVPSLMSGRERPSNNDLIAVVSGWDRFLVLAKLFLVAANIEADAILIRSRNDSDWMTGLDSASLIICDSLTARQFSEDSRVRVFPLIAAGSMAEIC